MVNARSLPRLPHMGLQASHSRCWLRETSDQSRVRCSSTVPGRARSQPCPRCARMLSGVPRWLRREPASGETAPHCADSAAGPSMEHGTCRRSHNPDHVQAGCFFTMSVRAGHDTVTFHGIPSPMLKGMGSSV